MMAMLDLVSGSVVSPAWLDRVVDLSAGINFLDRELASKQLELLRELVPQATLRM